MGLDGLTVTVESPRGAKEITLLNNTVRF